MEFDFLDKVTLLDGLDNFFKVKKIKIIKKEK